jgi:hypothetical protein
LQGMELYCKAWIYITRHGVILQKPRYRLSSHSRLNAFAIQIKLN